ncbi:MAG: arylamine N-acetyltransferase [Cytophagales bacterium]|nr:arylamine N-acetyltransferase [Cytophagales bacterium]
MNVQAYLDRIGYKGKREASLAVLRSLHAQHIFSVPFENLDIHYRQEITLEVTRIYKKVVEKKRGGFCYELNLLFHGLLREVGFESRIIAARIFDGEGVIGPAFDHMCLLVELEQLWLADVGFGDLFLQPIALQEDTIQTDGRNCFKVGKMAANEYVLLMSSGKGHFCRKYTFSTQAQAVSDFASLCQDKQTNPNSYFVKNKVCTKPTRTGRITLFNQKLIHKAGEQKLECFLEDEEQFTEVLRKQFDLIIE